MKRLFRSAIEKALVIPGVKLAMVWPSLVLIALVRAVSGIQLSASQLRLIIKTMKNRAPCRLLVFGLGNDTVFWVELNRGGETVFLEDNEFWLRRVVGRSRLIKAYLVAFDTRREDWKRLLESPSELAMSLPAGVEKRAWDVVVVDAPAGYDDNTPGRMKSIYMSSQLVKCPGDVFVHDCNREIEDIYSHRFLGKDNLRVEVRSAIGYLRHYHLTDR